jgi:hypothetical protein
MPAQSIHLHAIIVAQPFAVAIIAAKTLSGSAQVGSDAKLTPSPANRPTPAMAPARNGGGIDAAMIAIT